MEKIFFDNWESILRTLIITILAYISLIFLLRLSGKRTLSKMNAFDFIVTIALGSTLASVLLNKDVALLDGLLAFVLLIGLQYLISALSARNKNISNLVKSTPSLLVFKGEMLEKMMIKERIAVDEIYGFIRQKGFSDISDVDVIVLETDGSLSLIGKVTDFGTKTFDHLKRPQDIY